MNLSQFPTPRWACELIVQEYFSTLTYDDMVVEPSCGEGNFLMAIPREVSASGCEIDPQLALQARINSRRPVWAGDFREYQPPSPPTLVLGNPPFQKDVVDGFLTRCHELLPVGHMAAFILPAYIFQTCEDVTRWCRSWEIQTEVIPRDLFFGLSIPLTFTRFTKKVSQRMSNKMSGFCLPLYRASEQVKKLPRNYRLILMKGSPAAHSKSVWIQLIMDILVSLGGQASLQQIYRHAETKRPTPNPWWKEKIRQTLQRGPFNCESNVWSLN